MAVHLHSISHEQEITPNHPIVIENDIIKLHVEQTRRIGDTPRPSQKKVTYELQNYEK